MEGVFRGTCCAGLGRRRAATGAGAGSSCCEADGGGGSSSPSSPLGRQFGLDRRGTSSPSVIRGAILPRRRVECRRPRPHGRRAAVAGPGEASEVGRQQGHAGWGSCRDGGGLGVEHAARLPASGSPSSASSGGDGQRLQGTLMRTSSLPAVIEAAGNDEWKKCKEAQSLKRLEVKKKRIERRNSLTCNTSKEAAGQIPEEMNAHADKLVSSDEAVVMNNENHSSGKHLVKGLPPKYQATIASQDSLSAMGKKPNSAFKGTAITKEHSPSLSVPSSDEAISNVTAASPPPSSLPPRTATLGSMGDVERRIMQEMPGVFTKGLPNSNRVEGFLYKYKKGDVRIVCICHGSFLTPSEFVEHAGAGKVDNPLRHIVVSPTPNL
ncbi:unnamed protein product [Miscanthus lutarioriparius]|uniref:Ninja-family protein n=1 Tax=Miscanthus lutarioriparius TaxID=422564 RepID=A0A811MNU5_9POAL|nr:unnamed protein product [Miscanthus lutarioriparius]